MPSLKFTDDPIVRRLRWVMLGAMLFSLALTLAGQPASFWSHPATAIRGDGLSIDNLTNHTFDFCLGWGWPAYLAATLVYFAATFLAVSLLPRKAALLAIFAVIFGHYFGAANWLAVRWHLGVYGPSAYGLVLAVCVVLVAFRDTDANDTLVKRLGWVMVAATLLDFALTLAGQPDSYWLHPATMHEANPLSRLFLGFGWPVFMLYVLFYVWALFQLATILPRTAALIWVMYFLFNGFIGPSNWFFYEWHLGMAIPVVYGLCLGAAIVSLAFCPRRNTDKKLAAPFAPLRSAFCFWN